MYDYIRMVNTASKLHQQYNFSMVHCRSSLPGIAGYYLKRKFNIRMLFDIRGFWADERVEGGIWKLNNPLYKLIYRFFKSQEKKLYNNSDAIISLTRKAVPLIRLLQTDAGKKIPVTVIPCCADSTFFNPANVDAYEKSRLRKELELDNTSFVLSYLGAIGTWYLAEDMIKFFKRLLLRFSDAKFLFITKEDPEFLTQLAIKNKIPISSIIIRPASRQEVPGLLSLSDASVFFIKPGYSKQASSPTKQAEVMCMGIRPVFNEGVGDSDELLSNTGYGCSLTIESFDEVISRLTLPVTDYEKQRIRNDAVRLFSLENGIENYLSVYASIIKSDDRVHSLK